MDILLPPDAGPDANEKCAPIQRRQRKAAIPSLKRTFWLSRIGWMKAKKNGRPRNKGAQFINNRPFTKRDTSIIGRRLEKLRKMGTLTQGDILRLIPRSPKRKQKLPSGCGTQKGAPGGRPGSIFAPLRLGAHSSDRQETNSNLSGELQRACGDQLVKE
jgi:hypothetical protein